MSTIKESPYYYYAVLEVSRDATTADIKKSYKRLALKHHPDKNFHNQISEEKFKELSQAFQVLSDVEKRRVYDFCGGVDSSNVVISKRVEDLCSGIVVGVFSIVANVACATLIGIPLNIPVSYWMLISHLFTTWQMVPEFEAAKNIENWTKTLGTLISPAVLAVTTSAAAVYILFKGSKAALSYTQYLIGDYFTTSQSKTTSTSPTNTESLLSEEDFVLLDANTKTLENGNIQLASTVLSSQECINSRFQRSAVSESEQEWVLVDDQEDEAENDKHQSNNNNRKQSNSTMLDDWIVFGNSSASSTANRASPSSSSIFSSQTNNQAKFNKYHQLPEEWVVVDKFYA